MSDAGEAKAKAHEAWRKSDPHQRELIRQTKLRWAKKNAKFAPGTIVEFEIIPKYWGRGIVVENGRGNCLVQSSSTNDQYRLKHRQLRKVEA